MGAGAGAGDLYFPFPIPFTPGSCMFLSGLITLCL